MHHAAPNGFVSVQRTLRLRCSVNAETYPMNHRILRRPRTFATAIECSATQGLAIRRCYVFVYSHIVVWAAAALPDARSML